MLGTLWTKVISLLTDQKYFVPWMAGLLLLEIILNIAIVTYVNCKGEKKGKGRMLP